MSAPVPSNNKIILIILANYEGSVSKKIIDDNFSSLMRDHFYKAYDDNVVSSLVGHALKKLTAYGQVNKTSRGYYRITYRGLKALQFYDTYKYNILKFIPKNKARIIKDLV